MRTNDPCKTIREELRRRHGWTSRQVSVRNDHGSIRCVIKAPGVPVAAVSAIARQHEDIRRCEATGEILSGGNTYVSVSMDWDLTRPLDKAIKAWAETLPQDGTVFQPIPQIPAIRVWRHDRYDFRIEDDPDAISKPCHGSNTIGTVLACMLVERGITTLPKAHVLDGNGNPVPADSAAAQTGEEGTSTTRDRKPAKRSPRAPQASAAPAEGTPAPSPAPEPPAEVTPPAEGTRRWYAELIRETGTFNERTEGLVKGTDWVEAYVPIPMTLHERCQAAAKAMGVSLKQFRTAAFLRLVAEVENAEAEG